MMGMPLIDAANADDLAAVCSELSRYSFLLHRTAAHPRPDRNPRKPARHLLTATNQHISHTRRHGKA
jgi:hypothetical protein